VVHRREDPRRDAGIDLLQAVCVVYQQLDTYVPGMSSSLHISLRLYDPLR
jgi:hypothetical protein